MILIDQQQQALVSDSLMKVVVTGFQSLDTFHWMGNPLSGVSSLAKQFGSASWDIFECLIQGCKNKNRVQHEESTTEVMDFFLEDPILKQAFLQKTNGWYKNRLDTLTLIKRDLLFCTNADELIREYPMIDQINPRYLPCLAMLNRNKISDCIEILMCSIEAFMMSSQLSEEEKRALSQKMKFFTQALEDFYHSVTQVLPRNHTDFDLLMERLRFFSAEDAIQSGVL